MYVVAEHTRKSLLYFYLSPTEEEAVQVVSALDFIQTKEWAFYFVNVIEDADTMIQADSLAGFLKLVNENLLMERRKWRV